MSIDKIRRDNLERFIVQNYKNKRRFSLEFKINYGNLYSILKGERPFGERFARVLEQKLTLPTFSLDQQTSNLEQQAETKIAIYGNRLSAGAGNHIFNEEIIGYHTFNTADLRNEGLNEKGLCAFFVSGDSMLPEIQDGAKVLVDVSQVKLVDNKIYAVSIDNEIFIKKLFKDIGTKQIILRSENKSYPDKIYKSADELRIIGRVVYLLGKRL